MILRRLELQNIRSYREAEVDLPLGKTLFEGDIGSGKSTILMAIEFALFGFGTEGGGSMLRAGSAEGGVAMAFEVDGAEYRVERRLIRKGRGIQQANCILRTPEGDVNLSPSELKERMLEILGFNEAPDPRAQSWIYRYAVYTPQEEMKAVLALNPDLRLQVLRRAFGIEDYKVAAENATSLAREIRRSAGEFEGMSRGIDELRAGLLETQKRRLADLEALNAARESEVKADAELQKLRAATDALRARELESKRMIDRVELLERTRSERGDLAKEERRVAKLVEGEIEALGSRLRTLKAAEPPKSSVRELEAELDRVRTSTEGLTALEAKLAVKIEQYHTILEGGRCPVCDRKVSAKEFSEKEKVRRAEQGHIVRELNESKAEEGRTEKLLREAREYELRMEERDSIERDLKRRKADLERSIGRAERAEGEARSARLQAQELAPGAAELADLAKRVAEVAARVEETERDLGELRNSASRIEERIESARRKEGETEMEIRRREEAARRRDALKEHGLWLTDYFVPTVQLIERSVMRSLNQEFDSLFQGWFSLLVEDPGKDAGVDGDFTPIVSQDGYDQEVYYLSGGEKTSVSLAYRLALNSLVQRVSTTKPSILILDEPTDGFSKEQMGSVREVLDEVECRQVIVVSHEKELESFADQIYRVVKENGTSHVAPGAA